MTRTRLRRLEFPLALAAAALVMWALIALIIYETYGNVIDSAKGEGENLARSLAQYEESSVRAIDLSLQLLRDQWQENPERFRAAVARHEEHLSREKVIQVAVVDGKGDLLFSKLPAKTPLNFAERDYFRRQKSSGADELYIAAPVFGKVTRQWAIQFTRPIRDRAGNFAGLIVVAVPPPALENVYKDIQLGADGVISLARDDGGILARTGRLADIARISLAGSRALEPAGPPGGSFRARGRVDGIDRLFSYRRLQHYPLTVFVGQGAEAVLAPYYRQRLQLITTGALATLLLAALAALLGARARDRRRFVEERERLALDVHDGSIQSIYAIGMTLENCRRLLEKDAARAATLLAEAQASLNLVIQDLRSLISGQPPAPQTEEQFMKEIQRSVQRLGAERPKFSFQIDSAAVRALTPEQAVHVQRIAQEAVSNVVRHAAARNAKLSLALDDERVRLDVTDDGAGIHGDEEARLGLGLHHIQARARKLGGQAEVISAPERGTRVVVDFPRAR